VQQAQQNCSRLAPILGVVFAVLASATSSMGAGAPSPDLLLTEAKGPCNPGLDGPDYVPGTDVDGNPVVPADVSQAKVPLPPGVLVPLGRQAGSTNRTAAQAQMLAVLNQKQMDSILNPAPACPPDHKARP
jgi:hypothetical protein